MLPLVSFSLVTSGINRVIFGRGDFGKNASWYWHSEHLISLVFSRIELENLSATEVPFKSLQDGQPIFKFETNICGLLLFYAKLLFHRAEKITEIFLRNHRFRIFQEIFDLMSAFLINDSQTKKCIWSNKINSFFTDFDSKWQFQMWVQAHFCRFWSFSVETTFNVHIISGSVTWVIIAKTCRGFWNVRN